MEEKKKRWRPSLTAYREMEEVVHRQCQELDAWRDKYRQLESRLALLEFSVDEGAREVRRLRSRGLWGRILNR